jgi:hypothetical protein
LRNNKLIPLISVIFCIIAIIPCNAQTLQQNIIGKWVFNVDGDTIIHEYTSRQVIQTDAEGGNYSIFEYRIENNKLIVDDEEVFILEFEGQDTIKLSIERQEEEGEKVYIGRRIKD